MPKKQERILFILPDNYEKRRGNWPDKRKKQDRKNLIIS
jgi:hypothetical protein